MQHEMSQCRLTIDPIDLKCLPKLENKIFVITGANSGIGKETAKILSKTGCTLILGCRRESEGLAVEKEIRSCSGNKKVYFEHLNLASFVSVHSFAEKVLDRMSGENGELYCLVNNAGIFYNKHEVTSDGLNISLQVNYLGPLYLTLLLWPKLKESSNARIINVTSAAHKLVTETHIEEFFSNELFANGDYDQIPVYGETKLYVILTSLFQAKLLKDTNVTVHCIDPGNVATNVLRYIKEYNTFLTQFLIWLRFKTAAKAALEVTSLTLHPLLEGVSGKVWESFSEETPSSLALSESLAEKLWIKSLETLSLHANTDLSVYELLQNPTS